jgi:hypothetical protein
VSLLRFFELAVLCLLLSQGKNYFATFVLRCFTLPNKGELPKRLENFPISFTDVEQYQAIRDKVTNFIDVVLSGGNIELHLTAAEINHIYLKGLPIDKYRENFLSYSYPIIIPRYENEYLHFSISNNYVHLHYLHYPDTAGVDGVFTQTQAFSFKKTQSSFSVFRKNTEVNGRSFENSPENNKIYSKFLDTARNAITYEKPYPDFLLFLFGLELSPDGYITNPIEQSEYQKATHVIQNIQAIEITDNEVVITACSSDHKFGTAQD